MRLSVFLSLLLVILSMTASPAAAATWGSYNPTARTITATEAGRTLTVQMPFPGGSPGSYLGSVGGRHIYSASSKQYRLLINPVGASLFVTIDSTASASAWGIVHGPEAQTSGTWRRVDLSRYDETKGFGANQKACYIDQDDLWVWAFWKPEASKGTFWKITQPGYRNTNSGSGDFLLMPDMVYHKNTANQRQPLYEEIEIRAGEGLWDAVPTFPPSRISPWATELADAVYIDTWSHDSAAELTHLVQTLKRVAGQGVSFFTNWATWGSGGHSGFLPDSLWLDHDPHYLPNHAGFGSLERMQALADVGDAAGWLAFRTFYSDIKDESPSFQEGLVHWTLTANGSQGPFSKRGEWPPLYERQQGEIQELLRASGSFTDSLGAGFPYSYRDYDAAVPGGLAMDVAVSLDRAMADHFELVHEGPVTGEAVKNEVLIGPWVATGEYDMHNGRGRRMTPEYKLRRLHGLTTFHGMGQNYRFYDINLRWSASEVHRNGWRAQDQLDDYRATQLLFGNGGYVYAENHLEDAPWGHYLSEVLMVAPLQHHFALEPVNTIEYETSGQGPGTWTTLESLVENQNFVMETNFGRETAPPWGALPQSPELERIRVTYANGLKVVANRGATNFVVTAGSETLTLPPSGWAIWGSPAGNAVLAYSAYAPGTSHRIDYLEDFGAGVRFVDPRGGTHFEVQRPTQWVLKNSTWRKRLEADLAGAWPAVTLEGQRIPLRPSRQAAADSLDTDFSQGFGGWRTVVGARTATVTPDGLELDLAAATPFLHGPRLALAGRGGDTIEVDLRFDQATGGPVNMSILFQREQDVAFFGTRVVTETNIDVNPVWQTVTFDVGGHSLWQGQTITQLRFDPVKAGASPPVEMTLGAIRWVSAP